jgi:aspartate/methionine/tyrosine aminotransferase
MGTESGVKYLAEARALEARGVDVVHLEIGEPHFDTPSVVTDAAIEALRAGATHYGPPAGIPDLRSAIAASTRKELGVDVPAASVAVLPGSKMILMAILIAYSQLGDEVMMFEPGFPAYGAVARMLGCIPKPVPLRAEDRFRPSRDALDRVVTNHSRFLIANWPSNPLGTVLLREDAEMIAAFARDHDLLIVSDELYRGLEFVEGASLFGVVNDPARCVLMDGFSKRWAMTGWRLAYAVGSPDIVSSIAAVVTNTATCAATFTQHAGVAALARASSWQANMRSELLRLRDVALETLPSGLVAATPEAGLYLFAACADSDSRALAARLAAGGVATMPGAAFGAGGEGHLRITFSVPENRLREGMQRLAAALN